MTNGAWTGSGSAGASARCSAIPEQDLVQLTDDSIGHDPAEDVLAESVPLPQSPHQRQHGRSRRPPVIHHRRQRQRTMAQRGQVTHREGAVPRVDEQRGATVPPAQGMQVRRRQPSRHPVRIGREPGSRVPEFRRCSTVERCGPVLAADAWLPALFAPSLRSARCPAQPVRPRRARCPYFTRIVAVTGSTTAMVCCAVTAASATPCLKATESATSTTVTSCGVPSQVTP